MKNFKFLFFVFILIISFDVFADTSYDMTSRITSPVNYSECGAGSYTGVELNGATNCWNTNTRYLGTLNRIYFNLPAPTGSAFEPDTAYRLTLNMATEDWRNNFGTVKVSPGSSYTNNFVDSFSFVSMKQVVINFTVPYAGSTTYQYLWVNLPAKSSSHLITGVKNWNLSKITLTKLTSGTGGGSTTPSGPTTTFDDTAIINSGNENTQDIINNNNSNTSDIINNANQNTQDIVDSNFQNTYTCKSINQDIIDVSGRYLGTSGQTITDSNFGIVDYIRIYEDSIIKVIESRSGAASTCFYDSSKTLISCISNGSMSSSTNLSIPRNSYYVRFSINLTDNLPVFSLCNRSITQNSQDIINNNNSNTSDIINNSNQNTQDIVDSNFENTHSCKTIDKNVINYDNRYLGTSGQIIADSNFGIVDNIRVYEDSIIKVLNNRSGAASTCFYNSSKILISCISSGSMTVDNNLTIPQNAYYVRFSINKNENKPTFSLCNKSSEELTNTIADPNVDSNTGTGFFDDFTSQDFGLSQIITIPLNTIQSLTSKSCVPLQVPIPFTNSNVSLPCMTEIYQSKFSSIYNLWKIVSFGIVAYLIAIDIFHIVKGFKDPESDKVEVLDL